MALIETDHPCRLPVVDWYVIFCPPQSELNHFLPWPLRWVASRLDHDLRHCFALRPAHLGTIMLNCAGQQLFLDWMPEQPRTIAQNCVLKGWRALYVPGTRWQGYPVRGALSCVSVVKSALGMRGALVLTPRQLYRRLLRDGAYIISGA